MSDLLALGNTVTASASPWVSDSAAARGPFDQGAEHLEQGAAGQVVAQYAVANTAGDHVAERLNDPPGIWRAVVAALAYSSSVSA
jgi:hypothetical protein